ncbi:MAG TPA: hypothetical protein VM760_08910 [Sphingomicrobium sp.]|jgi:hypothetical protein|nr:hypothetical protein [Sphingomicrobium sp.]
MRKLILAAALALSLPACTTFPDVTTAPLAQTHIDEQALTAAYASFDVLLTAVDGLRDAGVLMPGSPRALQVKSLIEKAQDGLNTARAVREGLSQKDPVTALASATDAFRQITAILKGN